MPAAISTHDALTDRVHARTGRRVTGLRVELLDGTVVLRGTARSYHVKQLAQHAAREVVPAARLCNAIVVQPAELPASAA